MHADASPDIAPSKGAWLTVGALSAAYLMSMVDRQIPALLVDSIRADLGFSDTQVSLLTGLAFSLLYTLAAVPLARIGDLKSRKLVVVAGVFGWGLMTMICGAAQNFWQLFAGRLGVGLGEAALTPNAYAMIADRVSPRHRARAIGVFVVGAGAGYGVALLIGAGGVTVAAAVASALPQSIHLPAWRLVMLSLGLLTAVLAIVLRFVIIEGSRRPRAHETAASFAVVLRGIWRERRGLLPLFAGVPLMNLAMYGFAAWSPAMLMRQFAWSEADAGVWLGVTQIAAGILGTLAFAWGADAMRTRWGRGAAIDIICACALGASALTALLMLASTATATIGLMTAASVLTAGISVLAPAALQDAIAPDRRGQVSSLFLLVANLVGIGLGPTCVALVTDQVFGDARAVGSSIAVVCGVALAAGALIAATRRAAFADLAQRAEALA